MIRELGVISEVDVRKVWKKEATDFTPWLKENIDLLSKKLGIEIIDCQTEEKVGDLSLDIIGKESNSNKYVAIENQLEQTDHSHLGQLMTYSAGIDAGIIICIAKEFREEHKKALEWLNENSTSDISFFGVEVHAIQIDTSKPAIDLRIAIEPNDWGKAMKGKATSQLSETEIQYLNFFTAINDRYASVNSMFVKKKPQAQSWLNFSSGYRGLTYGWAFRSGNRFSVEVYIDTGDKIENEDIFDKLALHENKVRQRIENIQWERLEERKACRIVLYKNTSAPIRSLDEKEQKQLIEWGVQTMLLFDEVFSEVFKELQKIG